MPKTILIVEDEEHLVELLSYRLEANGYKVETAFDGKTGLKKIYELRPDLVILDIMMPVMHGYEVCEKVRNDKKISKIPIIMLTARIQQSDMERAKQCGADSFVTKPFEPEDLLEEIKKHI